MSEASNSLDKILSKLQKTLKTAVDKVALDRVGGFSVDLIRKRTRLGYGVKTQLGQRFPLRSIPHTTKYTEFRIANRQSLSEFTSPKKQNLTLTGQMLDSLSHRVSGRTITIEPTGNRYDTKESNLQIAEYNALRGRVFNRVSKNEFNQILRFYRKTFWDLLRLKGLLK